MEKITELYSLKNKIVIVAGGAGTIGFNLCLILAEMKAKVIIADLDLEMAQKKLSTISNKDLLNNLIPYKLDVSDVKSVNLFWEQMLKEETHNYKLYGLINCFHYKGNSRKIDNASDFFMDIENYPLEMWDKVHDVNLKGSFLMIQESIKYFKKNGKGNIINISSTYGILSPNKNIYGDSGINSPVAYSSSKSAILNLTRYCAVELAKYNIRVNTLTPGGVYMNQNKEFVENYSNQTPLKRMASENEYQGPISFLISDASSYMTGSNLIVDGGWSAW